MITLADFQPDELVKIQHAPVFVIAGAVASEGGGMTGAMVEMIDGVEGFAQAMARADDSLLTEIFRAIDQTQPDDFAIEDVANEENRDAFMQKGIDSALEAFDILRRRAGKFDADNYARALVKAAAAAVNAAQSGGFLGFGAEAVTAHEAEYVQELARALSVSPSLELEQG